MNKKIILFFSLVVFLPAIIYAETYWGGELPNITNSELEAKVAFDEDVYTYSYTIISSPANTGEIGSFDIDITRTPGSGELSGEGLVNGPGYLKYTSAGVSSETTTPEMIPVGLWSPANWISGLDVLGQAGWGAGNLGVILPGQSLSGFQLTTRGLPSIRDFRIEPELIPPSAHETDLTPDESLTMIQEVEDKAAFKSKTLGPTAPPADFKPIEFLDYIIDLKHEAASLRWITNKGIVNSLDKKLDNAGKKIEQGNTKAAKNILNAFLNELDAQGCANYDNGCPKGKHITPEAYALLKYNVEYLINQLTFSARHLLSNQNITHGGDRSK